jgi:hypothetical protein
MDVLAENPASRRLMPSDVPLPKLYPSECRHATPINRSVREDPGLVDKHECTTRRRRSLGAVVRPQGAPLCLVQQISSNGQFTYLRFLGECEPTHT